MANCGTCCTVLRTWRKRTKRMCEDYDEDVPCAACVTIRRSAKTCVQAAPRNMQHVHSSS
eukprot:735050-Amphidinium_carterae.1